jgi:hypothetical protein
MNDAADDSKEATMTATLTSTPTGGLEADVASLLRHELLRLAAEQERLAAAEAAQVPYWAPSPASVEGHRAAARALLADADRFGSF